MKEKCIYAHNTDQLRKTTDPVPEFAVKIYEKLNRKKRNQVCFSRFDIEILNDLRYALIILKRSLF